MSDSCIVVPSISVPLGIVLRLQSVADHIVWLVYNSTNLSKRSTFDRIRNDQFV